jgi:hypothetical protein
MRCLWIDLRSKDLKVAMKELTKISHDLKGYSVTEEHAC